MNKSKWLSWLLGVITIVSLPLSYYWYVQATKEVDPTFILETSQQQIISKSLIERAPLKIIKSSGQQVEGSVYLQKFYFFNQGREVIKPENVLKSLHLTINDQNAEILDYKIIKVSDSVTQFSLERDTAHRNRIYIKFKILEEDDGVAGQVIYSADSLRTLKISGLIQGARSGFSDVYKNKIGLPHFLDTLIRLLFPIFPIIFTALLAILIQRYFVIKRKKKNEKYEKEMDEYFKGKSEEEIEAWLIHAQENQNDQPKNPIWEFLTTDYILTIRNANKASEKSSITFKYHQVILSSVILFSTIFIVSLLLSTTFLKRWFDPRHNKSNEIRSEQVVPRSIEND